MAHFLQLHAVSFNLSNGESLFSNLNGVFSAPITALIGRNGVGKTVLAQLLAGILSPAEGAILNCDHAYYLPQHYEISSATTISELLGIHQILEAITRIESGSVAELDFEIVADHWLIEQEAMALLEKLDLPALTLEMPAIHLSGGEQMRIRIASAFLSGKKTLILDEPSNHLDRAQKGKLWEMMQAWQGQIILISHDRFFLTKIQAIVELTSRGLEWFTGNFSDYQTMKQDAQLRAIETLASAKHQEKRRKVVMQEQIERQQKRTAQANRDRGQQNQAKILLDRQKNRSDLTTGKTQQKMDRVIQAGVERVSSARSAVDQADIIHLHPLPTLTHQPAIIARLENVRLPFIDNLSENGPGKGIDDRSAKGLNLMIRPNDRIAIRGDNGIGKSLLLQVIAGILRPKKGQAETFVKHAYLDQHLTTLNLEESLLTQISKGRTHEAIALLRMQLAQLGLRASHIEKPCGLLSGGERLKGALALILYDESPAGLLLLDEPSNHLDLASLNALEAMLNLYQGGLVVISHDDHFLQNIKIETEIIRVNGQWIVQPLNIDGDEL